MATRTAPRRLSVASILDSVETNASAILALPAAPTELLGVFTRVGAPAATAETLTVTIDGTVVATVTIDNGGGLADAETSLVASTCDLGGGGASDETITVDKLGVALGRLAAMSNGAWSVAKPAADSIAVTAYGATTLVLASAEANITVTNP